MRKTVLYFLYLLRNVADRCLFSYIYVYKYIVYLRENVILCFQRNNSHQRRLQRDSRLTWKLEFDEAPPTNGEPITPRQI